MKLYQLNFIDTPGTRGLSCEGITPLAACEGALLAVDVTGRVGSINLWQTVTPPLKWI